jgi:hypothetical protein
MPVTTGTGGTGTVWLTLTGTVPHGSVSQLAWAGAEVVALAGGPDVAAPALDGPLAVGLPPLLHAAASTAVSATSPARTRNGEEGRGARMTASDRLQTAGVSSAGPDHLTR